MIRSNLLILIFTLLLSSCSDDDSGTAINNSEEPKPNFNNLNGNLADLTNFGGSQEDDLLSMTKTSDGHFVAIGFTKSNDGDITDKTNTDADYWVVKFDDNLELIWSRTFGGSDDDRGQNIIETPDGRLAAVGFSRSSDGDVIGNEGFHDFWFVVLSANGAIIKEKNIGFSGNDRGFGITNTNDGGYFISGFLDVTASGGQGNDNAGRPGKRFDFPKHGVGEFWGIKLDASANMEWRRYFGGSNNDRSYAVLQTDDGGFLMTGHSESDDFDITNPRGSYDFWVVRLNENGELLWEKNLGGSSVEFAYDLTTSNTSSYFIVGDTRSANGDISNPLGNADAWLVNLNDQGNIIWEKTYGGSNFDSAKAITPLDEQNFAIAGDSQSDDINLNENKGQNDAWIMVIGNEGDVKHSLSFGGNQLDFANDVVGTNEAQLIGIGSSASQDLDFDNQGDKDAIIFKIE
jgi:hypothetical protein